MNYKWNYEAPSHTVAEAEAELAQALGIHPVF
ncbi:hypothetical protein EVA_03328, partial [gut metagenome]